MKLSSFFAVGILLSTLACASSDNPISTDGDDEDLTAAVDASEPQRAEVVEALKKVNRAKLLPTGVAYVTYAGGTLDLVSLREPFSVKDEDAPFGFPAARDMLKTRGFRIVGKNVSYRNCKFSGPNDYLLRVSSPRPLTDRMRAMNEKLAPDIVQYSDADFATAKALEARMTYKLTLTKESLSVYLGKENSTWKILAIDKSEYLCERPD